MCILVSVEYDGFLLLNAVMQKHNWQIEQSSKFGQYWEYNLYNYQFLNTRSATLDNFNKKGFSERRRLSQLSAKGSSQVTALTSDWRNIALADVRGLLITVSLRTPTPASTGYKISIFQPVLAVDKGDK